MKLLIVTVILINSVFTFYQSCGTLENGNLFLSSFTELKPDIDCSLIIPKCFEEVQENNEALTTLLKYCDGSDRKHYGTGLEDNHFKRLLQSSNDALQLFERNNAENCSRINVLKDAFLDDHKLYSSISVACFKKIRNPFSNLTAEDLISLNSEVWGMFLERTGDFDGGLSPEVLENAILKENDFFLDSVSRIFIYLPFSFFTINSDALKLLTARMSNLHQELLKLYSVDVFDPIFDQSCTVCLDGFGDSRIQTFLNCGHAFHQDCVDHWFRSNPSCPNCRKPLVDFEADEHLLTLYDKACFNGLAYEVELLLRKIPTLLHRKNCVRYAYEKEPFSIDEIAAS